MHFFTKSAIPIALALVASSSALGDTTPKWFETNDTFVTYGLNSDDYGTYISVGIEGPDNRTYMCYNFDILLPPGLTFPVTGATADYLIGDVFHNLEDGFYPMVYQRPNWVPDHQLSNSIKDNGCRAKVICVSFTNQNFSKPTGRVADCFVTVHPLAKAGENKVKFREMALGTNDELGGPPIEWAPHNTLYNIDWGTITIPAERSVPVNISASDMWGTITLPFAFDAIPEGVEAYTAVAVNSINGVELQPVTHLEAYKPYVIYAPEGWNTTLNGIALAEDFPEERVPAYAPAKAPVIIPQEGHGDPYPNDAIASNGVLQANIKPHTRTDGFTFAVENGTPMFKRVDATAGSTLNIGDVFITPDEESEKLADTLPLNKSVNVSAEILAGDNEDAPVYNLQGEKITNPAPGSIYIKNGNPFLKR